MFDRPPGVLTGPTLPKPSQSAFLGVQPVSYNPTPDGGRRLRGRDPGEIGGKCEGNGLTKYSDALARATLVIFLLTPPPPRVWAKTSHSEETSQSPPPPPPGRGKEGTG